jgi:hypothetical protein
MSDRRLPVIAAAALAAGLLAACSHPAAAPHSAPSGTTSSAQPSPATTSATPVAAAPTCTEIRGATVTGLIDPYYGFGDAGATLTDGQYAGDGGLVLAVQQPCATGDLGGEIGTVTVGTIMNSVTGTTGRIWNVMLCGKPKGQVRCVVHFALDDRDPIESVSVSGQQLTLMYLTRPDGGDPTVDTIRRTAIYAADGSILKERSHTDTPYSS